MASLSPTQLAQYQNQRNTAKQGLLTNQAQNQYQSQLLDISQSADARRFGTQWDRTRVNLPTNYIQRGVFDSGIYQTGLQNYALDRYQDFEKMQNQYQQAKGGLALQGRGYQDDYARQMYGSYGAQYASAAELAAQLRGVL